MARNARIRKGAVRFHGGDLRHCPDANDHSVTGEGKAIIDSAHLCAFMAHMVTFSLRTHLVRRIPKDGSANAILRCIRCGHTRSFPKLPDDGQVRQWKAKAICSRCKSRDITLDLFRLENPAARPAPAPSKACVVCGQQIDPMTLEVVPYTRCCTEHFSHNPQVSTRIREPMGSREDFKRDSAANFGRARSPSF